MNDPIDIRRDALRPNGAILSNRVVTAGTAYTPSTTRSTLVILVIDAGTIGPGESADFRVGVFNGANLVYEIPWIINRSGLVTGTEGFVLPITFLVPAGHNYKVTDLAGGSTLNGISADEVTL